MKVQSNFCEETGDKAIPIVAIWDTKFRLIQNKIWLFGAIKSLSVKKVERAFYSLKATTFCLEFGGIWYPKQCARNTMGFSKNSEHEESKKCVTDTRRQRSSCHGNLQTLSRKHPE